MENPIPPTIREALFHKINDWLDEMERWGKIRASDPARSDRYLQRHDIYGLAAEVYAICQEANNGNPL